MTHAAQISDYLARMTIVEQAHATVREHGGQHHIAVRMTLDGPHHVAVKIARMMTKHAGGRGNVVSFKKS